MIRTITQADVIATANVQSNSELPTLFEFDQDDTLYLLNIDAVTSETTTANGNVNVWLFYHDDKSFALEPEAPRQLLVQVPLGIFAQSRLNTFKHQFRTRNPGLMQIGVYDIEGAFSIELDFSLVALDILDT